jgi:hypothetical protein
MTLTKKQRLKKSLRIPPLGNEREQDSVRRSARVLKEFGGSLAKENTFPLTKTGLLAEIKSNIYAVHGGQAGDVVVIGEKGIAVEFWDGFLWEFFDWSEVKNAKEIKAAYAALTPKEAVN